MTTCTLPPKGWHCTLEAGHTGPCPTWRNRRDGWPTPPTIGEQRRAAVRALGQRIAVVLVLAVAAFVFVLGMIHP